MHSTTLKKEAEELFDKLSESDCFLPGLEQRKRFILRKLISMKDELLAFARAPDRALHEVTGYFVECCARLSKNIPRNTRKAERFSRKIIIHLHRTNRCNPDYLWLSARGQHLTITGIGEVKSHINAIWHSPIQTFLQEQNVRNLVFRKQIPKILSVDYKVMFDKHFIRRLILPRNTGVPYDLPLCLSHDWHITEIELTLAEILFIRDEFLFPQERARRNALYPHSW